MLALLFSLILPTTAIPTPTPTPTASINPGPNQPTTAATTTITATPPTCTAGSTLLHTTDCTLGTPTSYCYSPPPPIECKTGSFPGVWHPGHCIELSTCYPLTASWLTTECSYGAVPWSTSTLYEGTLAGGRSTAISVVSCSCNQDQWYSFGSNYNVFCMPKTSCPPGMTTSVRTNQYCATAPASACSEIATTTNFCECADSSATPVYPDKVGAGATGCM